MADSIKSDSIHSDYIKSDSSAPKVGRELNTSAEKSITSQSATAYRRKSPLKSFHIFPQFPEEVKIMIWEHSIPEGRVIEIMWNDDTGMYYTDAAKPAILEACAASRIVAKKIYHTLTLDMDGIIRPEYDMWDLAALQTRGTTIPFQTFIDFERDHIFLSAEHVPDGWARAQFLGCLAQSQEVCSRLRSIILDKLVIDEEVKYPQIGTSAINGTFFNFLNLLAMPKLETIYICADPSRCYECGGGVSRCHRRVLGIDSMGIAEGEAQENYAGDVNQAFTDWQGGKLKEHLTDAMERAEEIWGIRKTGMEPKFALAELFRQKERRYRTGPYAMPQPLWT